MRWMMVFLVAGCGGGQRYHDVDFAGANLRHFKPKGGLTECESTCRKDKKCFGFVYGKSASRPGSYGKCYLKKDGWKYNKKGGKGLVSGIK